MSAKTLPATETHHNVAAGIGFIVLGIFLFAVNDVVGKWVAATYSAPQILLFRSIAALLVLMPLILRMGISQFIMVHRPWLQVLRAVFATIEVAFFYWAVRYLPLADTMTYYLAGPIYVTLIAAMFLGEKVGWRRWTAVIAGFGGVVIALGPSFTTFGWPSLIPIAGSIVYSVFLIMTRSLRGTPDTVMATWQVVAALLVGLVGTPFAYTPPASWTDTALLFMLGVVSLIAVVCINRSLKFAPASVVVPYQYTLIVWAIVFGYFVFGDVPGPAMLIGAAIIIAAGLFIFFREQKLGKDDATSEVASGP